MAKARAPNRRRSRTHAIDRQEVSNRIQRFWLRDLRTRDESRDMRLQRYAKYRGWTEAKDWPWPNASNIPLTDITEKSDRLQDTLVNAVLSQRPAIVATATEKRHSDQAAIVDSLIDYQVMVEQDGEHAIGEAAQAFINDPSLTVFVPWIREFQEVPEIREHDPIPEDMAPSDYFASILAAEFPSSSRVPVTSASWDWEVTDEAGETMRVSFYTEQDDRVQAVWKERVTVYEGPRLIVKDYDDVLYPHRASNLQPPSPSNPGGAQHVILRDYPTIDEIRRLYESGYYNLMTKEEADVLENHSRAEIDEQGEQQKDTLAGHSAMEHDEPTAAKSHRRLTRLLVFDGYDMDGDGRDEQVVWWYLLEPKLLVRARLLGEVYPFRPPRRPVAGGSLMPVQGRFDGRSLPEVCEGLHDAAKVLLDQGIDAGTMSVASPFWYRPASNVKPETIGLEPGMGYPVADPQRDIVFPQIGNPQAIGTSINLFTLLQQMEERVTTIGDMQLGRVPPGRASALRTLGGMSYFAGQGEARPERILRRFFHVWADVWTIIHGLDRAFLPDEKQIRIVGALQPGDDPYRDVRRDEIAGHMRFDFSANVLNTSRQAMQEALEAMIGLYLNPVLIQLGVVGPDGVYRLMRDYGKARGQDPDKYLAAPTPAAAGPRIYAQEAIASIMDGIYPVGQPAEPGGVQEHMEALIAFAESENFGLLSDQEPAMFNAYLQQVGQQLQQERQTAMMAQMQASGGQQGQGQPGRPATQPPPADVNPQVSSGAELLDETLPGAGGGGAMSQ